MPCPLDRRQEVAIDRDALSDTPDVASIFASGHGFSRAASVGSESALAAEGWGSPLTVAIRRLVGRPFRGDIKQDEERGL
jgi:hypothetical protein